MLSLAPLSLADAQDKPSATEPTQAEADFLAENDAAMTKMMTDMAAKPTGDIDRDFVAMMTPHHQGAIDMARAYLRYGKNEQLSRLAQEIVVAQGQEITVMRHAIGDPPPSTPESGAMPHHNHPMPPK
ncbi:DUF305 domain-containing protein [Rhodomicrobium sp. R_RK_3]|uniref:DUF305 domain-containing protein n=1 Tax=Rhodomicrobium TaxID=1068 RepID=UPI0032AEE448